MSYPDHLRAQVEDYLAQLRFSEEAGTDVLLSFRYSRHRRFPGPVTFGRAFRGFRERYPDVETWGWVPDLEPIEDPEAWHPLDLLVAPLYGPDGA